MEEKNSFPNGALLQFSQMINRELWKSTLVTRMSRRVERVSTTTFGLATQRQFGTILRFPPVLKPSKKGPSYLLTKISCKVQIKQTTTKKIGMKLKIPTWSAMYPRHPWEALWFKHTKLPMPRHDDYFLIYLLVRDRTLSNKTLHTTPRR